MLRGVVVIAACLVAACGAQKAEPPKINSGFLKKIFFRDVTDSKTLDCTADGIPAVDYEWHRNGVKVSEKPGTVEVTGGRLQLLKPTINDEGFYQCFANNKHGKSMSTVVEMQKAQLLGYKTLQVANIGTHDAGSHVTLTCRDQPMSVPTAVYDWYIGKSDAIVTGGRIVIDQVGDLHFINVEIGDELVGDKTYNCSLYNVVAQLRVYGSPTKFKVNPVSPTPRAPSVVWYTDSESSVALLGKTITLQCIPDGYPLPKIEWSRTGGSLPVGRHVISEDKYTLEISNVTEADEGTYTCAAVHGGQKSPQNIFVDVKSEPIWEEKLKSVIVTAGKSAEFRCVARSAVGESDNPLVQWYQNGKPLNAGKTGKITVSGTKLTVEEVRKPYDLMNIQCNVSNSIGYQLADAFLNVIDRTNLDVKPEPKYLVDPGQLLEVPIMAVADPLYHRHLTYRWSKNGQAVSKNPADPVYVDVSNTLIVNATTFEREQRFLDLLGNYSCLVSMGLEKGEGDVVASTLISSDEEEAIIAEAAMDLWWIAIIIAVIVLILIIILICCLLYRNRGGTYPVDEKERRAGHDPEKELADSGFQDLSRADAPDEKKPYGNPDQVSLTNDPPLGGDTDSLDEYGEPDSSKFNEDGSFIGNYGGRKGRDMNQSTV